MARGQFLYMIRGASNEIETHIKIGIAFDVQKRLRQLQTGSSAVLTIVDTFKCDTVEAAKIEQLLHSKFGKYRIRGEWFAFEKKELQEAITVFQKEGIREQARQESKEERERFRRQLDEADLIEADLSQEEYERLYNEFEVYMRSA